MSDPPPHLLAFRWALVVVVVLVLTLASASTSWPEVATTLDPVVDALRRSVWG